MRYIKCEGRCPNCHEVIKEPSWRREELGIHLVKWLQFLGSHHELFPLDVPEEWS